MVPPGIWQAIPGCQGSPRAGTRLQLERMNLRFLPFIQSLSYKAQL